MPTYVYFIIGFGGIALIALVSSLYYFFKNKNRKSQPETAFQPPFKPKTTNKLYFGMYEGFGAKMAVRLDIYVYVIPQKDSCPLCRVFENQILVLANKSDRYMTMHEAIAAGYHHLGCSHQEANYYFQKTTLPEAYEVAIQEEAYQKRLALFQHEAKVRAQDYAMLHADNPAKQRAASMQKEQAFAALKAFCQKNNLPVRLFACSYHCVLPLKWSMQEEENAPFRYTNLK